MIRESFPLEKMNIILRGIKDIKISKHYLKYINQGKRDIPPREVIEFIKKRKFYFVEKQINGWIRYKIIYELSNRYDLVIIIKEEGKVLKVVSAYKTNKKLKEKWKKMFKSHMIK